MLEMLTTLTGTVTISGTPTEGEVLTAANTLADEDGLGTISYQWNRDGSTINGATAPTYTIANEDVGKNITVTASYTDGGLLPRSNFRRTFFSNYHCPLN